MPDCKVPSKDSVCDCSEDKLKLTFDANQTFTDKNDCQGKTKSLKNVKLSDLASQIEAIARKIKEVELHHLVDPIKEAASKLRLLDEYAEKIACDCNYGDYQCDDENCNDETDSSSDSCVCCSATGAKSCHCGSEKSLTNDTKPNPCSKPNTNCRPIKSNTYDILEVEKCQPCSCAVDSRTGKRAKSSDCKLAAKARRRKRRENRAKEEKGGEESSKIVISGGIAFGALGLNAAYSTIRAKSKEFMGRKNQANSCNLSGESSSECSSDTACCDGVGDGVDLKGTAARRKLASSVCLGSSQSSLGSCGCGRQIVEEGQTCPCGCGDMMDLPVRKRASSKYQCRCTNCGKEITEDCRTSCAAKDSRRQRCA